MDDELRKLIEDTHALSKENHEMLRKIRGVQKRSQIFKVLYWLVVIGIAFGAFYYIKPYLQSLMSLYGSLNGAAGENFMFERYFPESAKIQGLIDQFQSEEQAPQ